MRFLQVGLGSMGKRRLRCLKRLGYSDIVGFDMREDRRKEAEIKYGIKTISTLKEIDFGKIDTMIISTPPDKHDEYIEFAIKIKKPAFVEASVVIGKLEELERKAKKEKVIIIPSCTLKYHPAIKEIIDIVKSGYYGKVTNFTYHCGQYLPDWHPYENIKSFYVSKRETSAAREMVPFELTWLVELVGFPKRISGFKGKAIDLGVDIDDTYVIAMEFEKKAYGVLNVDVVSRFATRNLILNLEHAQILWRWDENVVKVYDARNNRWIHYFYSQGQAEEGYNKNIAEDMYVNELNAFIQTITGKTKFPNSLKEDIEILKCLEKVEESNETK